MMDKAWVLLLSVLQLCTSGQPRPLAPGDRNEETVQADRSQVKFEYGFCGNVTEPPKKNGEVGREFIPLQPNSELQRINSITFVYDKTNPHVVVKWSHHTRMCQDAGIRILSYFADLRMPNCKSANTLLELYGGGFPVNMCAPGPKQSIENFHDETSPSIMGSGCGLVECKQEEYAFYAPLPIQMSDCLGECTATLRLYGTISEHGAASWPMQSLVAQSIDEGTKEEFMCVQFRIHDGKDDGKLKEKIGLGPSADNNPAGKLDTNFRL